jgi:hypothetical protein
MTRRPDVLKSNQLGRRREGKVKDRLPTLAASARDRHWGYLEVLETNRQKVRGIKCSENTMEAIFLVRSSSRNIRYTNRRSRVYQRLGVVSALSFSCLTPRPTLRAQQSYSIDLCLALAQGPTTGRICLFSLSRSVAARC